MPPVRPAECPARSARRTVSEPVTVRRCARTASGSWQTVRQTVARSERPHRCHGARLPDRLPRQAGTPQGARHGAQAARRQIGTGANPSGRSGRNGKRWRGRSAYRPAHRVRRDRHGERLPPVARPAIVPEPVRLMANRHPSGRRWRQIGNATASRHPSGAVDRNGAPCPNLSPSGKTERHGAHGRGHRERRTANPCADVSGRSGRHGGRLPLRSWQAVTRPAHRVRRDRARGTVAGQIATASRNATGRTAEGTGTRRQIGTGANRPAHGNATAHPCRPVPAMCPHRVRLMANCPNPSPSGRVSGEIVTGGTAYGGGRSERPHRFNCKPDAERLRLSPVGRGRGGADVILHANRRDYVRHLRGVAFCSGAYAGEHGNARE